MTETTRLEQPFAITPVWVARHDTLTVTAKALYTLLASYSDSAGYCWPSQQTLVRHLRVTERTVRRAIDDLVEVGAITVERPGKRRNNRYKVGGHQRPPTGRGCVTDDRGDRTPEPSRDRTPRPHELEPVQLEPVEQEVVMRQTDRPEPITDTWEPDDDVKDRLARDCQGLVNLDRSLRRFRNYYIEKGARSRAWDHKFEAWVLNDLDKMDAEERSSSRQSGVDDLGLHPGNKASSIVMHPDVAAALEETKRRDREKQAALAAERANVINLDQRRPA